MDIGPRQKTLTVSEVRDATYELIQHFKDHEDVSLLGLVITMIDSIECTCQPPTPPTTPAKMINLDAARKRNQTDEGPN